MDSPKIELKEYFDFAAARLEYTRALGDKSEFIRILREVSTTLRELADSLERTLRPS